MKVRSSVAINASTVLLLEDEPLISMDIQTFLEAEGFVVSTAMSCVAAMSLLDRHRPDIAIVDIGLRDGTCTEVALRLLAADIPFIVYSGDHPSFHVGTPFSRGRWVTKPAAPQDVVQILNEALAASVLASSGYA